MFWSARGSRKFDWAMIPSYLDPKKAGNVEVHNIMFWLSFFAPSLINIRYILLWRRKNIKVKVIGYPFQTTYIVRWSTRQQLAFMNIFLLFLTAFLVAFVPRSYVVWVKNSPCRKRLASISNHLYPMTDEMMIFRMVFSSFFP